MLTPYINIFLVQLLCTFPVAFVVPGVRFTPGGIRKGASGHNVVFIHPKGNEKFPISGCGALIELVQAPPDVIAAMKRD
jgi:hypothetical protein